MYWQQIAFCKPGRYCYLFFLSLLNTTVTAQFAPAAGQVGSTAIYKDSSIIQSWATSCTVIRGYQDISKPALGYASAGKDSMALGKAGTNGVVSLGDGGSAIVSFGSPITNGPGWDFVVFENSFSDTFLELAFVEVSSDGVNFFRFPASSLTQDSIQIDAFGALDPAKINNLAGKYRALYGTPFDLEELSHEAGLDVNNISHVKIIDVVGCIQEQYATFDQNGHKINDPWNTPFESGGFDLDAVGVIHPLNTGLNRTNSAFYDFKVYPNPLKEASILTYSLRELTDVSICIVDMQGKLLYRFDELQKSTGRHELSLNKLNLNAGIYFIRLQSNKGATQLKISVYENE